MIKLVKYESVYCGPCKAMEHTVESVMKSIVHNIDYEKVDVDELNDVDKSNFNLKSVPTFVIYNNENKELSRKVGVISKSELQDWLLSYLK